jgi:uncharacterized protein (DUF305 family)
MPIRPLRIVRLIAAVTALVAVVAAACGKSSDHPQTTDDKAGHNRADVVFATDMIPHHQQALDLSAVVPNRSTDPALIKLASGIATSQAPQIQKLKGFVVQWSEQADSHSGGQADTAMHGMVDQATMTRVASLQGTEFDKLWLQSMIGHHRGALEMAQAEIKNGVNTDAVAMAHSIVTSQQAEIDQMTKMLESK